MTDADLQVKFDRLRQGDAAAFESLYSEMKVPIYTVLLRITQNRWLSEDLFQDFFVALYQRPPGPEVKKPRAYLFQTAHNLAVDALRKIQSTVPLEEGEPLHSAEPSLGHLDLEEALGRLSLAERQVVVLHLNGGFKFREISKMTGEPIGTLYSRYQKAIGKLRAILNGDDLP